MFSGEVHPFTQYIVFRDYKVTKSRKKNKVKYPRSILIGHLPPPLTGQSAAFSTAIKFFQEKSLPFVVVDIAGKVSQRPIGQFAWGRVWEMYGEQIRLSILALHYRLLDFFETYCLFGSLRYFITG